MNDDLNPNEEQFLDVLLAETLADESPPDLTRKILRQLAEEPVARRSTSSRSAVHRNRDDASTSGRRKQLLVVVSAVATLAASVVAFTWLRSDADLGNASGLAGVTDASGIVESGATSEVDASSSNSTDDADRQRPPRGIPLAVQPNDSDQDNALFPSRDIVAPELPPRQNMDAVTLVSSKVRSEMQQYWDSVGIVPTADAAPEQVSARLAKILGVQLASEAINDPQQVRVAFQGKAFSKAIADNWLVQITDGGLRRVAVAERDALVKELGEAVRLGSDFDLVLTGWLNGSSPNAGAFYAAIAAGRAGANDEAAMIRRLASITMNVDLRCTRCHDAYIDGRGQQDEYWNFTAMIRRGVRRSPGKLEIDPDLKNPPTVFYETADGRQRLAEAGLPAGWVERSDLPRIEKVSDWTKTLVGSEVLARGVVNSLWQWVHGQPLRGRVVDPITAPHNDALHRLEANLVDDLVRSRFDVARTLTLIISAPVTSRGVPEALLPENALVADEADAIEAMHAVNAFAAALPPRPQLPRGERVAQVLRSVGASLDSDGQPFVAQMGENGSSNARPRNVKNLASDFPLRTGSVPVQWLSSLDDYSSQVAHLAYLGGLSRVPTQVMQAAEVTREVEDENTGLHRTWWLVRP